MLRSNLRRAFPRWNWTLVQSRLERRGANNRFETLIEPACPERLTIRFCNGDSSTRIPPAQANVSMAPGDLGSYMFTHQVKGPWHHQ
jgi:hypothetical protein